MVSIIDPYSGATASPYFQLAGTAVSTEADPGQSLVSEGTYENTISRHGYEIAMIERVVDEPETPADEPKTPGRKVVADPGGAKSVALSMVRSRGWGDEQYICLERLWQKESNWRVNAANRSSGAYGIPQALPGRKMASAGADWESNAATQIKWGLGYISGRYGSPCGAWGHSKAKNWY
ncbi:lytic transglycosylase domain-containing protein [Mycetocola tolaasinivorans]|uniref:Lytic transglycosylase domain-containing protein n=2 Tax=Mycetocola tolaasinivorans TaxID=76635 RepID=A0A3L7A585_9MICO|nr:lytic transglycosylase domain-containing protein [Mycetocola tolaasinivorans]